MKLHYSALCKGMFLYMVILLSSFLFFFVEVKGLLFQRGGVVTAHWVQRGIRDRCFVLFLVVLTGNVRRY